MAVRRSGSSACCGFIFCSNGSTCRTRRSRRRSMIRRRCAVLSGSISAASRRRTRPRCAAFAICSKPTGEIISEWWARSSRNAGRLPPESAHIGVDSCTKLIHAVVATPANVADSRVLPQLLHGRETRMWGDQAYRGQRAVIRQHAPRARDFTNRRYRYRGMVDLIERAKNRTKSKVRARVEHSIGRQAGLRLCQGARSRAQQERAPAAGDLRPRQFVHRPVPSAARTAGVVRLKPAAAA